MNHRRKNKQKDDQTSSDDLTRRVNVLHDETAAIHEEWQKLHKGPKDENHLKRHS